MSTKPYALCTQAELWFETLERFDQMRGVTTQLLNGLTCNSNTLNIPPCAFCRYKDATGQKCDQCNWGKTFGFCREDNGNRWREIFELTAELRRKITALYEDIYEKHQQVQTLEAEKTKLENQIAQIDSIIGSAK